MPKPPYLYRILSWKSFDLTDLGKVIEQKELVKQTAFERASRIQARVVQVRNEMEIDNSPSSAEALDKLELEVIEICDVVRREREGNTSGVVEDFIRAKSFWYFIQTGKLLPQSSVSHFATDEEYLAGACMGMCQDLARYAMGRAIARDMQSIREARDLVSDLMQHLLDYDFPNSYLRRRFLDAEFSFRTLETIMYEVHMTAQQSEGVGPVKKRAKIESRLDTEGTEEGQNLAELVKLSKRMECRQDLRDQLEKKCRLVKKASQKAIFFLHQGDAGRAYKQLAKCEEAIKKEMWPIIAKEPPLKAGIFSKVMEDYAEAKLFYSWMWGKEETPEDTTSVLLKPDDFPVEVGEIQYLVGLVNVTSEIVRYSMQARTERNFDKVKHCLASCAAVSNGILSMERLPMTIGKTFGKLKTSVGRLERMLYEMSLSTASGGQKIISETSIITSSSLVPNLPRLSGTGGASSFGVGASAPGTVSLRAGASSFPGLAGPPTAMPQKTHNVDEASTSSSSESEGGNPSPSHHHVHFSSSDGRSYGGKKRDIADVVKDAIGGSSIPMTLEVKSGKGAEDVPVTLSVIGEGKDKTLTLTQKK